MSASGAESSGGMEKDRVDDIPVLVARPGPGAGRGVLALWMHFLGGTKEAMAPYLLRLARAGVTAVSFDAWQHGGRTEEPPEQLTRRAFDRFRRNVWPILGHTTLDAVRVLDWAVDRFEATEVVAAGVSMGGDVSVALAGIDPRVSRVAAIVATPDWTRPGMTRLDDPSSVIDQGEPTAYGQWLYDHLDPMTHLSRFARGPAIGFDLGGEDRHISAQHALAFHQALEASYPAAAQQVRVRIHEGLDHLGAARDPRVQNAGLAWLVPDLS
jgi:dienelactone hydrolase